MQASELMNANPPAPYHQLQEERFSNDVNKNEAWLNYNGVGGYHIVDGKSIETHREVDVSNSALAVATIGTPLGVLFYQRGYTVLHGSCVVRHGEGLIFLGDSGAGKSSIALSCISKGWQLVSDDVVVLDMSDGGIRALSSYPLMKVDNQLALDFKLNPSKLISYDRSAHKKLYRLNGTEFAEDKVKVKAIILPEWSESTQVQVLCGSKAMIDLVPHVYGPVPRTKYPAESKNLFHYTSVLVEKLLICKFLRPVKAADLHGHPDVLDNFVFNHREKEC